MSSVTARVIARSLRGNRLYGTQAVARQADSLAATKTKLPNGLTVASVNNDSPLSRISFVVNAGARKEGLDEIGITHALRRVANLGTKSFNTVEMTRTIQMVGAYFSCTSTRELMIYTLTGKKGPQMEELVSVLGSIVTEPLYNFWELDATYKNYMAMDLAILQNSPNAKLAELLHNAAYRGTLGRSLYAPEHMVGKYTQEQLCGYVKNNYVQNRMALIGVGIGHDVLESVGNKLEIGSSSSASDEKALYCGGERMQETTGDIAYVAVANEGVSCTSKDYTTAMVLQMLMGTDTRIKYTDSASRLSQALGQVTSKPFSVSCLNMNYSDSGLFGFHIQGDAGDIDKMVKKATEQFASVTKGTVTDQEVAAAKYKTKAAIAMHYESEETLLSDLSQQIFTQEQFYDLADINKAVDAIQTADVVNLAKRIVNGTSSVAATGNVQNVPHLTELLK